MTRSIKLFHAFSACSRVTLTALEQIGVPYEDQLLEMQKGEHRAPEFLKINPNGKVPTLVVDGKVMTENGAILSWLNAAYPEADLLPRAQDALQRAQQLSDLFWVSSVWHPYVRANKVPFMWTTGDIEPVRDKGRELLMGVVKQLEEKLAKQKYWYGEDWSIIDTYLWWAYINAEIGGFPLEGLDNIAAHRRANEGHPALQRALAREQAAVDLYGELQT